MWLTEQWLVANWACDAGIAWFNDSLRRRTRDEDKASVAMVTVWLRVDMKQAYQDRDFDKAAHLMGYLAWLCQRLAEQNSRQSKEQADKEVQDAD